MEFVAGLASAGASKGHDIKGFVKPCCDINATQHVAQKVPRRRIGPRRVGRPLVCRILRIRTLESALRAA